MVLDCIIAVKEFEVQHITFSTGYLKVLLRYETYTEMGYFA